MKFLFHAEYFHMLKNMSANVHAVVRICRRFLWILKIKLEMTERRRENSKEILV